MANSSAENAACFQRSQDGCPFYETPKQSLETLRSSVQGKDLCVVVPKDVAYVYVDKSPLNRNIKEKCTTAMLEVELSRFVSCFWLQKLENRI